MGLVRLFGGFWWGACRKEGGRRGGEYERLGTSTIREGIESIVLCT